MNSIRKRLTYANVMSSIAVFLVLGGATAVGAKQLGKQTVGAKQLKRNAVTAAKLKRSSVTAAKIRKNAVTGAKVKDGSLTGADISLGKLGTVPRAATADRAASAAVADQLAGRTTFKIFIGEGQQQIGQFGPFTLRASCEIDDELGEDRVALEIATSADGSAAAFVGDDEDEYDVLNAGDGFVELLDDNTNPSGEPDVDAGGAFFAVAPSGFTLQGHSLGVGVNIANRPGQCFFTGVVTQQP